MMDGIVVLTPLLALAVVLLLGFAGCEFEGGIAYTFTLALRVRVPSNLTVTRLTFEWTPPDGTPMSLPLVDPTPLATDGADNVFGHDIDAPPKGPWMTACRLRVREGAEPGAADAKGDFTQDNSLDVAVVTYQAYGSPTDNTFGLAYLGVTEGAMA